MSNVVSLAAYLKSKRQNIDTASRGTRRAGLSLKTGLLVMCVLALVPSSFASALVVNPSSTFTSGTGFNSSITAGAKLPNGKFVVGGNFIAYNGVTANRVAVLNIDGSLDTSFSSGAGPGGANPLVRTIAVQPDGKILVGGGLTDYDGTPVGGLARLNANGTLDTTFNTNFGSGANGSIWSIDFDSTGRIFIGGSFNDVNGTSRGNIARLNANGSLDTSFGSSVGTDNTVRSIMVQTDNMVVFGGPFTSYNSDTNMRGLARADTSGIVDTNFNTAGGFTSPGSAIKAIQPDGKLIFDAGSTNNYHSSSVSGLIRLNGDGTLDSSFASSSFTPSSLALGQVALQPDGKLLVTGGFTSVNGVARGAFARFNTNGTLDTTYEIGTGFTGWSNVTTTVIALSNNSAFVAGGYTSYNGATANHVIKLGDDQAISGTVYNDQGVTTMGAGRKIALLINGVANSSCAALTAADGKYSITCAAIGTLTGGEVLTLYIDDQTENGVTYTTASGPAMSGIDIYRDRVITRSDGSASLSYANIQTGTPATDPGIQTNDISTLVTTFALPGALILPAKALYIPAGQTLTAGSNYTSVSGLNNDNTDGGIYINGTFTTSDDVELTGDWYLNPSTGTYSASGNQVRLTSLNDHSFTNAATFGSHLVITPASTKKVSLLAPLNLGANASARTLTIDSGYLDLNGQNLTMGGGTFANNVSTYGDGGVRLRGSETITFTGGTVQDSDSGIWEYYGDGTGVASTYTLKDFGAYDFYRLWINDTSASNRDTFRPATVASSQWVKDDVRVTSGTLSQNNLYARIEGNLNVDGTNAVYVGGTNSLDIYKTVNLSAGNYTNAAASTTIGGNFSQTGGSFAHNNGPTFLTSNVARTIRAIDPFYNLYSNGSASSTTLQNALQVANDFSSNTEFRTNGYNVTIGHNFMSGSIFRASAGRTLSIGADMSMTGVFYPAVGDTVAFTGTASRLFAPNGLSLCNLTKLAVAGASLGIQASPSPIYINCNLSLSGVAGSLLQLRTVNGSGTVVTSGTPSTLQFTPGFGPNATANVNYLDIQNNTVSSTSSNVTLPVNPPNSRNSGSTTGWFGLSLSAGVNGAEPGTPLTYTVTAAGGNYSLSPVTVNYQFVGGSATAGSDYVGTTTSVTIPSGATSATITVPVLDDTVVEPTETVVLALVSNTGGYTTDPSPVSRYINDNDDNDGDGVGDSIENLAPGGDGNGDGIADRLQSNVTTTTNPVTGSYTTLTVNSGCNVTSSGYLVVPSSSLARADSGYTYPLGLNSFGVSCATPGQSTQVTLYYDKFYDSVGSHFRHFSPSRQAYDDISALTTYGTAQIAGVAVTTASYTLTDGGLLDDDGVVNGTIIDPAGPAVPVAITTPIPGVISYIQQSLAYTGQPQRFIILITIIVLLLSGVGLSIIKRVYPPQNSP